MICGTVSNKEHAATWRHECEGAMTASHVTLLMFELNLPLGVAAIFSSRRSAGAVVDAAEEAVDIFLAVTRPGRGPQSAAAAQGPSLHEQRKRAQVGP